MGNDFIGKLPPCSLCLRGCGFSAKINHGDTENTEVAQRNLLHSVSAREHHVCQRTPQETQVSRKSIIIPTILFLVISQPMLRSQTTSSPTQDETASLITAARAFIEQLVNKNFTAAVGSFDDTMKGAMPEPKMQETWNAVLAQFGPFKQAGKARTEKRGVYTIVIVTAEFQHASLDIKVVFDQSKRIAGLFFAPATNVEYTPPAYAKPDSFREKEMTIGVSEWALPATLTTPAGPGPFPVVVLVHG